MAKEMSGERIEILWRLLVLLVSGIILYLWSYLIIILSIVNWILTLFTNKRDKGISDFCEIWNSEAYRFARYITMQSNEKPFPFNSLKTIGKFEK